MHPLLVLVLVPVGAAILLLSISYAFALYRRINDRAGIEEVRRLVTAMGFAYQKCNVGSSWFVAHFQTPEGAAKARFRYNRKTGIKWEKNTIKKSISYKPKRPKTQEVEQDAASNGG